MVIKEQLDRTRMTLRPPSVMEDPSAEAIARVYAGAFLGAAETVGVEGALEEFASFIDDVLVKNREFSDLLFSGILSRDEKMALIDRAVAPYASELFANFLRVLARHERMGLLPLVVEQSRLMYEARAGRKRVLVTSARPLPEEAQNAIRDRLREALALEPVLDVRVDPSLLGGAIIQIGDTVYDSSLRARLKQLRHRLRQRSIHEIQSGRDRFSSPEGD